MTDAHARLAAALEGRYTLGDQIGAGGMATVYLGHDVRHDRKVAIKVLKPELAAVMGAERFLSEIRTTANLQHPHVLALFDSGEADGFLFYVMPFVEGETLRDLIDREKQLPIERAVDIATKVANALDHAHRNGVVHRDIKPANILLHEGEPVVADFGIALAVQEAGGGRLTETGLSLGTPYYMSPEQATGDRVPDARSDVYSLGSVLYEMLTGEPPFQGTTAQSVLGKILTGDVTPPTEARKSLPHNVAAVAMKALERLPADRFESAGEISQALSNPSFRHGTGGSDAAGAGPGFWKPLALASSAAAVVMASILVLSASDPGTPQVPLLLAIPVPEETPLLTPDAGSAIQISGDGSTVAWVGLNGDERQLFIRRRDKLEPRPVPNTTEVQMFFISPDGSELAFMRGTDQSLHGALTESGSVRLIAESVGQTSGDWTSDGWIYFQNAQQGISRIPDVGGAAEELSAPAAGPTGTHSWVDVLPNGEAAIFTNWGQTAATDTVSVIDFATGTITPLVQGVMGTYSERGYLIYSTDRGQIMAAPFDLKARALTAQPLVILDGVRMGANGEAEFSISDAGSAVYRSGTGGRAQQLVWVARDGTMEKIDTTFTANMTDPVLSPDGSRVAFLRTVGSRADIWVKRLDLAQAPPERLTVDGDGDDIRRPAWSPNSERVYYVAIQDGPTSIRSRRADGTGDVTVELVDDSIVLNEVALSPDGEWMVVRVGASDASRDIVGYRTDGTGTPVPMVATQFNERAPAVSPDGRWLAYASNQAGRSEIYVKPFPDTDSGFRRISSNGGTEPVWSWDGTELFYKNSTRRMVVARLDFSDGVTVTDTQELFATGGLGMDRDHAEFSLGEDGRVLAIWRGEEEGTPLRWMEHFMSEVESRFARQQSR